MLFIGVIVVFFIAARVAWQKTAPKAGASRSPVAARIVTILAMVPALFFCLLVATDPGANLVVVNAAFTTTPLGVRVVSGAIENRTSRAYANVQLQIDLLNAAGSVVGFTIAATSRIPAGNA